MLSNAVQCGTGVHASEKWNCRNLNGQQWGSGVCLIMLLSGLHHLSYSYKNLKRVALAHFSGEESEAQKGLLGQKASKDHGVHKWHNLNWVTALSYPELSPTCYWYRWSHSIDVSVTSSANATFVTLNLCSSWTGTICRFSGFLASCLPISRYSKSSCSVTLLTSFHHSSHRSLH